MTFVVLLHCKLHQNHKWTHTLHDFLFVILQLEEGSVFRHAGERKVRALEDDEVSVADSMATEVTLETVSNHEDGDENDSESEDETEKRGEGDEDGSENLDCDHSKENVEGVTNQSVKTDEDVAEDDDVSETVDTETGYDAEQNNDDSDDEEAERGDVNDGQDERTDSKEDNGQKSDEESCDTSNIVKDSEEPKITVVKHCGKVTQHKLSEIGETDIKVKPAVVEFPDTEITLHHVKGDK